MEPMTLGSPSNGSSATNHYLPSFLMGDNSTNTTRGTLSPSNITTSPQVKPSSPEYNRFLTQKTLFGYNESSITDQNLSLSNTPLKQHNQHVNGPPIQDLFDSLRPESSAFSSPSLCAKNKEYTSQNHRAPSFQKDGSFYASTDNGYPDIGSPISNFKPKSLWVTVFGFPSNAIAIVLEHFSQCGTITEKAYPSQNGNWLHLKYASTLECDRALNSNQKIICGNIMIGVTYCQQSDIIERGKENTPSFTPLSQISYKQSKADSAVAFNSPVPQRSSGLVNKAMDYLFGW